MLTMGCCCRANCMPLHWHCDRLEIGARHGHSSVQLSAQRHVALTQFAAAVDA
jgi:hypothetical protein